MAAAMFSVLCKIHVIKMLINMVHKYPEQYLGGSRVGKGGKITSHCPGKVFHLANPRDGFKILWEEQHLAT